MPGGNTGDLRHTRIPDIQSGGELFTSETSSQLPLGFHETAVARLPSQNSVIMRPLRSRHARQVCVSQAQPKLLLTRSSAGFVALNSPLTQDMSKLPRRQSDQQTTPAA